MAMKLACRIEQQYVLLIMMVMGPQYRCRRSLVSLWEEDWLDNHFRYANALVLISIAVLVSVILFFCPSEAQSAKCETIGRLAAFPWLLVKIAASILPAFVFEEIGGPLDDPTIVENGSDLGGQDVADRLNAFPCQLPTPW